MPESQPPPHLPLYQDICGKADNAGNTVNYVAAEGLRDAVNVALLMRRPLLLTGRPGTGKTTFAKHLQGLLSAWGDVQEPKVVVQYNYFNTRSTSSAKELFYEYDAIRRFHDRQNDTRGLSSTDGKAAPTYSSALPYMRFKALGLALIRAADREKLNKVLDPASDRLPSNHADRPSIEAAEKQLTVVLIDEVDKAPRDFPNDILNILEEFYFEIDELASEQAEYKIAADPDWKPIIILTSNSEKNLPDPFLRRCVYHDIPMPDGKGLKRIVEKQLPEQSVDSPFIKSALRLWNVIRKDSGFNKEVSAGEMLDWLRSMHRLAAGQKVPPALNTHGKATLCSLLKGETEEEQNEKFSAWMKALPNEPVGND